MLCPQITAICREEPSGRERAIGEETAGEEEGKTMGPKQRNQGRWGGGGCTEAKLLLLLQ